MQLIVTHTGAGFDALAALVAAVKIFPGATGFLPEPSQEHVSAFVDLYRHNLPLGEACPENTRPEAAIMVCTQKTDRLGPFAPLVRRAQAVHIFDHHCPEAVNELAQARLVAAPVGATTTLLVEKMRARNLSLTELEAALMALGIYESTASLTGPGTTPRDVAAALFLWQQGFTKTIFQQYLRFPPAAEPEQLTTGENAVRITVSPLSRGDTSSPATARAAPAAPAHGDNLLPLLKERLSERLRSFLLLIGQRADRLGATVYLVGGVIRDLLLGCSTFRDFDCVVLPAAIPLARDLQRYFGGALKVNEQFGTATLFLGEGLRLDLATARRDFYAAAAALPRVEAASLKNDLLRRDFTINTLACSLQTRTYGKLLDFFSGVSDLQQGLLRTLYRLSFVDDPLRILRAVRLANRFHFTIEEETRTLMLRAIRNRTLEKVSRQRLNHEISLIYAEESPPDILHCLQELGLLTFLYPRLQFGPATWTRLQQVRNALPWARLRTWSEDFQVEPLYAAALCYDLGQGERVLLLRRLQLPRLFITKITTACTGVPAALEQMMERKLSPTALAALLEPLPVEGLILVHAFGEKGAVREQLLLYLDSLQHRRPHLTGKDLAAAGLQPGPFYRQILNELKVAVLDGLARTPAEEHALLRDLLARHSAADPAINEKKEAQGGFQSLPNGPAHSGTADRHHRA